MIVDSGNSPAHARDLLKDIEELNIAPVKYLVITHYHWDHVFGIDTMNLITIGHPVCKEKLKEYRAMKWDDESIDSYLKDGKINEMFNKSVKQEIPNRDELAIGDLDILIEDEMEINLGNYRCIVKAVEGDHTDDSLIVYLPKDKTVFLGDCIYGRMYDGVYGYKKEVLTKMVDKISKYDADKYFISHEEEINTREDMLEFWHELKEAMSIVSDIDNIDEATEKYIEVKGSKPDEDSMYYLEMFTNMNKSK